MVLYGVGLVEGKRWIREALRARFPILAVDQYQDLGSPLHWMIVALCLVGGVRLLAVGDPDQSIYGFTGSQPELLQELCEFDGVEVVRLRFNYRCGTTIVTASEVIIGEERGIRVHLRAFWPLGLISVNPEPPVMPGSPADRSQLQRTGMALSGQLCS